jgi:hypothetical protein
MFSGKTEIEKADLLGERLVGGATETASLIVEKLGQGNNIEFRDDSTAPQFIIEVIVFYMHLVDRLALAHFGAAKREIFGNRFVETVFKTFLKGMNRELPTDHFGRALLDTYNSRQMQYAKYKVLIPKKDDSL